MTADPNLPPDELGDDRMVSRGFWRSIAAIALVAVGVVSFTLWPVKSTIVPGSGAPATAPAQPPSASIVAPKGTAFRDVAAVAGVDFKHESGARGNKLLPECLGGGVAIVDLNCDDRLDLVFTQGQPLEPKPGDAAAGSGGIRIYLNATTLGGPLAFTRLSGDESLAANSYANGLAIGDIDGNGRAVIYIACVGQDRLLLNMGDARTTPTFVEAKVPTENQWGTSAGMIDADGDGDLDIVVANYVQWSPTIDRAVNYQLDGIGRAYGPPTGFAGASLTLLVNDGATLREVIESPEQQSGIAVKNPVTGEPYAKALGLAFVDADRDGRIDILVANDKTPKFLLRNLGPSPAGAPRFADIGVATGFAFDRDGSATGAMGIDIAWPRNNAELAVAIGNFANEPNSLYFSAGPKLAGNLPFKLVLSDESLGQGYGAPTRRFLTFGAIFVDVDLDGDEDLVQANGHLEPDIARIQPSQTYAQRGQLFINRGGESVPLFIEAPEVSIGDLARPCVGRALGAGDLDGDGDSDLVLVELNGPARILLNEQSSANHWIALALDSGLARFGSEIEVTAVINGASVTQRRVLSPTRSYLTQCEPWARFGLGDASQVDRVVVRLPDGRVMESGPMAVNQQKEIRTVQNGAE